jgi:hypothetical protein
MFFANHSLFSDSREYFQWNDKLISLQGNTKFQKPFEKGRFILTFLFWEPLYETTRRISGKSKLFRKSACFFESENLTDFWGWNNAAKKMQWV